MLHADWLDGTAQGDRCHVTSCRLHASDVISYWPLSQIVSAYNLWCFCIND